MLNYLHVSQFLSENSCRYENKIVALLMHIGILITLGL